MSETYLFMSNPRPVATGRAKYRDPEDVQDEIAATSNLMWDHRVVRGMPSGKPVQVAGGVLATQAFRPTAGQLRKEAKQKKERLVRRGIIRPAFPSVAEIHASIKVPKKRVEVPLHLYLQEQVEPVVTHTLSAQTDTFVQEDYELAPQVYIPRKTGKDIATQVDNKMVFQFDSDVLPVLETVISKTLEQSLMEVRHEEEMDHMRLRMEEMVDTRARKKQEMKQREDEERALEQAKNKLRAMAAARRTAEKKAQKQLASRAISMQFLRHLDEDVFASLTNQRYFEEPVDSAVRNFLPWLYSLVETQVAGQRESVALLDEALSRGVTLLDQQKKAAAASRVEAKRQEALLQKQRAESKAIQMKRRGKIELTVKCEAVQAEPIGPILLNGENTTGDLFEAVVKYLKEAEESQDREEPIDFDHFVWLWGDRELSDRHIALYELGESLEPLRLIIDNPEARAKEEAERLAKEQEEQAAAAQAAAEAAENSNSASEVTENTETA